MVILSRALVVSAAVTGLTIGFASPAFADPLSGSYTVNRSGGGVADHSYGVIMTPCGTDCTSMLNDVGGNPSTTVKPVQLHLQGSNWTGTSALTVDGKNCTFAYSFDKDSLAGTEIISACGPFAEEDTTINLTKNG
jgi:hypothetical protein